MDAKREAEAAKDAARVLQAVGKDVGKRPRTGRGRKAERAAAEAAQAAAVQAAKGRRGQAHANAPLVRLVGWDKAYVWDEYRLVTDQVGK